MAARACGRVRGQSARDSAPRCVRRARRPRGRLSGGGIGQSLLHPLQTPLMTSLSAPSAAPHGATLDDVAVLMPAFNGQADVERTLASFSEDAPVHVLIVDDGSTPPVVAPTLPNLSIEVLRMPHNVGIERALHTGIEALAARGFRYAARIDVGDLT